MNNYYVISSDALTASTAVDSALFDATRFADVARVLSSLIDRAWRTLEYPEEDSNPQHLVSKTSALSRLSYRGIDVGPTVFGRQGKIFSIVLPIDQE